MYHYDVVRHTFILQKHFPEICPSLFIRGAFEVTLQTSTGISP